MLINFDFPTIGFELITFIDFEIVIGLAIGFKTTTGLAIDFELVITLAIDFEIITTLAIDFEIVIGFVIITFINHLDCYYLKTILRTMVVLIILA